MVTLAGKQKKIYFDEETARIWNSIEPEIKRQYNDNVSQFFQHFIQSFDGKGRIEARIKIKEMERNRHLQRAEELKAEIEGLRERLDTDEDDDVIGGFEDDITEHPEYEKAMEILKRKEREEGISGQHDNVQFWANKLGVSPDQLADHVKTEVEA